MINVSLCCCFDTHGNNLAFMQDNITKNIEKVRSRISTAEKNAGRISGIVQLIAVSKTRTANEIRKVHQDGVLDFGENYLQEAMAKQDELSDLDINWHFIGPIQSNKTSDISSHFDWVHSVERFKIARRLNDQRPEHLSPLNICLQVNISEEDSKSGILLAQLPELAAQIHELPRLRLRGLMAIPSPTQPQTRLRDDFKRMQNALDELNSKGFQLDTLSMGMSNDLECAIAEGATMVRIGTAIFGPRSSHKQS